jgi:hypothetical protein
VLPRSDAARASPATPPRPRRTTSLDTASPRPLAQELELRRGERERQIEQEREVHLDNERGNKRTREEEEIRREEKKGKKKRKNRLSVIYKLY